MSSFLTFKNHIYLFCLCMYVGGDACTPWCLWRSESSLLESVLTFYHVAPGDPTRAVGLVGRRLYLLTTPIFFVGLEDLNSGRACVECPLPTKPSPLSLTYRNQNPASAFLPRPQPLAPMAVLLAFALAQHPSLQTR